jgi:hypothetical protein
MSTPETATESTPLKVRRGRVASVDLYEVKDNELDLLEKGSPASIQLNFAIFLLSIAFGSIASLCTATFQSETARLIFIFIAVIGVLMGVYLLIIWWKTKKSISDVVNDIKSRMETTEPPIPKTMLEEKKKPASETEPSG